MSRRLNKRQQREAEELAYLKSQEQETIPFHSEEAEQDDDVEVVNPFSAVSVRSKGICFA